MRILFVCFILALAVTGCHRSAPTVAGGKPVRYWVEALQGPDPKLRKAAAFKLGNVGPADRAALPALVAALGDADPAVRCEAIIALMKCGAEANQAVPTLKDLRAKDSDPKVRDYANCALKKLLGIEQT